MMRRTVSTFAAMLTAGLIASQTHAHEPQAKPLTNFLLSGDDGSRDVIGADPPPIQANEPKAFFVYVMPVKTHKALCSLKAVDAVAGASYIAKFNSLLLAGKEGRPDEMAPLFLVPAADAPAGPDFLAMGHINDDGTITAPNVAGYSVFTLAELGIGSIDPHPTIVNAADHGNTITSTDTYSGSAHGAIAQVGLSYQAFAPAVYPPGP